MVAITFTFLFFPSSSRTVVVSVLLWISSGKNEDSLYAMYQCFSVSLLSQKLACVFFFWFFTWIPVVLYLRRRGLEFTYNRWPRGVESKSHFPVFKTLTLGIFTKEAGVWHKSNNCVAAARYHKMEWLEILEWLGPNLKNYI